MSIELVSEVFNHCPAEVSPAERLILLAIAEQAQDKGRTTGERFIAARECFPGQDLMERMTGLGKSGFGDALRRLSKRNLEVRVSIAVDKAGRPVYAAKGHNTVYRLPVLKGLALTTPLDTEALAVATPLLAPKALATARPLEAKGLALTTQRSCSDDSKVLPQQGPNHKEPEEPSLSKIADAIPRPEVDGLLDFLDEGIQFNGIRKPSRNKKNRDAIRLLLDRDKFTHDQVRFIIQWACNDEFWRTNILSASKLREKFPQLMAKAGVTKQQPAAASFNGEIDPDAILGKDYWVPGTPPADLTFQEEMAWKDQQTTDHHAERLTEARRRLTLV